MKLALHLENQQSMVFFVDAEIEYVQSRQKHTTLTAWFVANQKFPNALELTTLIFLRSLCGTNLSVNGNRELRDGTMIARVYSAHPWEGRRFYLRILLNHVTCCMSFQDIRTLPDGTVCDTYKESALRRGLLEDDQEADQCLAEAAICYMPAQLRQLFVTILLFVEPSIPLALWDKYKAFFAEDFLCRAGTGIANVELDEHILNSVLLDLEYRLQKHGKSLADYPGMPIPTNVRNRVSRGIAYHYG